MNEGIHIRIADVIYGVMKRKKMIIIFTMIGLAIGMVLSGISYLRGEMSKKYLVTSSFSVNTVNTHGVYTSGYDFPSYNDITMAEQLVSATGYVVKSDMMLDDVIKGAGLLDVTSKDISDNLTISQYDDTQILEMSLYWRNSDEGIAILDQINALAPAMLKEVLGIGTVSVINAPSSKFLLGGSIKIVLWGYMTFFGFALGIGLTLLELIVRPTLLNVEDMENVFGLDVLCEVADDTSYFDGKLSLTENGTAEIVESFSSAAHIINTKMRKIASTKIIYVTSTMREEGKTSLVANLGKQLAEQEKKVLLIDFDLKNPKLGKLFLDNIPYEHSLNALYADVINETEAITSLSGYLDILPAVIERNTIPLDSNILAVIQKIAEKYDYVLIDSAPVGVTADPMSFNQIATAALFVVRYDMASMQEIGDALERIEKSGVSIVGSIVNGVQVSRRTIYNPVKEKEKLQRTAERNKNSTSPVLNVTQFNYDKTQDVEKPLVAEFGGASDNDPSEPSNDMLQALSTSQTEGHDEEKSDSKTE